MLEPILIVPESMHSSGDFDNGSVNNFLSLAIWKDHTSASDEASSPVRHITLATNICLLPDSKSTKSHTIPLYGVNDVGVVKNILSCIV